MSGVHRWPTGRTRTRLWQAGAAVVALLAGIFYLSGGFHRRVPPGTVEDRAGIPVPAGAVLHTVEVESILPVEEVVGTVASEEFVHLSSRVNAHVGRVEVSAGDRVRQGQILVALDDREPRQQLLAAEADHARAEGEYQRTLELFREEAATRRQLDADEAAFRGARARLEEIQVLLSHTRILSPIDGVVVDRRVEAGDLATVGTVLLTVYDPRRMRLEAPVPLRLAGRLRPGDRVEVVLDASEPPLQGEIQEIVAEVDPQSRTRLVKVLLPGEAGRVLPGMFGRLLLPGDPRPAILVPPDSVYRVGQLAFVQVVREGRALRRAVRPGGSHGGRLEILSGLQESEKILASPILEGE